MSQPSAKARRTRSPTVPQVLLTEAQRAGVLPLEYMLGVMNDPAAAASHRDRMAIAAAQYCHQRAADTRISKKAQQASAAKEAGTGSEWAGDLDPTRPQ